jgi:hypothetical protein
MDKGEKDIIIFFEAVGKVRFPIDFLQRFHTHIYCHRGSVDFVFSGNPYKCKGGEFVFWFADSKLTNVTFSKNFKAAVLLVEKDFLNANIPDQSRSIDAYLHSRENPVLHLNV